MIEAGRKVSSIGVQDFIKMITLVRELFTAGSSVTSFSNSSWRLVRQQLYCVISDVAKLPSVTAPFDGSILSIFKSLASMNSGNSIDHLNVFVNEIKNSSPESTIKFDLLKMEILLINVFFSIDIILSDNVGKIKRLEAPLERLLTTLNEYCCLQLSESLSEDAVTIRSRKFKSIQKTMQSFLVLFEGMGCFKLQLLTISSFVSAFYNNFSVLMVDFSTWESILKSVYNSIKRWQSTEEPCASVIDLYLVFQTLGSMCSKINESFQEFVSHAKDGSSSASDVIAIICHISQLMLTIRPASSLGEIQYRGYFFWEVATLIQLTEQLGVTVQIGGDLREKFQKYLQTSASQMIMLSYAAYAQEQLPLVRVPKFVSLTMVATVLEYWRQEIRQKDKEEKQFRSSNEWADMIIRILSLPQAKHVKQLLSLAFDILVFPFSDVAAMDDVKLINKEIISYTRSITKLSPIEETLVAHIVSWWNEDILLSRYSFVDSSNSSNNYCVPQTFFISQEAIAPSSFSFTAVIQTTNSLIPAVALLSKLVALWMETSAEAVEKDIEIVTELGHLKDLLTRASQYLSESRRRSRNSTDYLVSSLWKAESEKQTFLLLLESSMEQVKPVYFQPFVDYYFVKSLCWMLAAKVFWFSFDDLLTAEMCAKKAYSYAHNRSISDSAISRWMRIETLLFTAELSENLGKTSRAVDAIVDAWSLSHTSDQQEQLSPLSFRVLVSALRHWIRIESTRLQELVRTHLSREELSPQLTETLVFLSTRYPSFREKCQRNSWIIPCTSKNSINCCELPYDLDLLWKQSGMQLLSQSEPFCSTDIALTNVQNILQYSIQCPFPLARHLRKRAAILLSSEHALSHAAEDNMKAFIAGASAGFITLERTQHLSSTSTSESVSLMHQILTSSANSTPAHITNICQYLDAINSIIPSAAETSSTHSISTIAQVQIAFLTFDVISDTILCGVYRPSLSISSTSSFSSGTDGKTNDLVEVCQLAGSGRALQALIHRWSDMLQRNHDLLRRTKDIATVAQMTEQEKRQWWKQREQMEEDVETALKDFESLLGPLLSFLFPSLNSIPQPKPSYSCSIEQEAVEVFSCKQNVKKAMATSSLSASFAASSTMKPKRGKTTCASSIVKSTQKNPVCEEEIDEMLLTSVKKLRFLDDNDDGANEQHDEFRPKPLTELCEDRGEEEETNEDEIDRLVAFATEEDDENNALEVKENMVENMQERCTLQQYEGMKVNDLKVLCKEAGLPVTGKKSDLIDRLMQRQTTSSLSHTVASLEVAPPNHKRSKLAPMNFHDVHDSLTHVAPTPSKPSSSSIMVNSAKKLPLTASKMATVTKHPAAQSSSAFLRTAQKSAGKRLIDVFEDDDTLAMKPLRKRNDKNIDDASGTAATGSGSNCDRLHTILLLDEQLQQLPVECMPSLRYMSISRMLSLPLLLDILRKRTAPSTTAQPMDKTSRESSTKLDDNVPQLSAISAQRAWFALDAENNLPTTRATLLPLLEEAQKRWNWPGFIGEIPSLDIAR